MHALNYKIFTAHCTATWQSRKIEVLFRKHDFSYISYLTFRIVKGPEREREKLYLSRDTWDVQGWCTIYLELASLDENRTCFKRTISIENSLLLLFCLFVKLLQSQHSTPHIIIVFHILPTFVQPTISGLCHLRLEAQLKSIK